MHLANNEYTFHFKSQGEKTKEWFEGDFTFKCILNLQEQMDVALKTDRYNGGSRSLAPEYILFNRMIAELEMRIVRDKQGKLLAPTWWIESKGGWELHDTNLVFEAFNRISEAEQEWQQRLKDKAEQAEKQVEKSEKKKKSE